MYRRDFIKATAGTGTAMGAGIASWQTLFGASPNGAFRTEAMKQGPILLLIHLQGGNDGLNTVVPVEDRLYYNARPNIALSKSRTWRLNDSRGFHYALRELKQLFDAGELTVIDAVGAGKPAGSHTAALAAWHGIEWQTPGRQAGWLGKWLERCWPAYPQLVPADPPALGLASTAMPLFVGPNRMMALAAIDDGSGIKRQDLLPGHRLPAKLQAYYEARIRKARSRGRTCADYPDSPFGYQLSAIAEMIGGGLQTPVYALTLDGFDLHECQPLQHAALLKELSLGIGAIVSDLKKQGCYANVYGLVYSEFGRSIKENARVGTDDGNAGPVLVFGANVNGGRVLCGNDETMTACAAGGAGATWRIRDIQASVLAQCFGAGLWATGRIVRGDFERLPLFGSSTAV